MSSVSEFTSIPYQSRYFPRTIASRSRLEPQVMAYWLMSAWMAAAAASFRTSGAGKLEKPWARFDGLVLGGQPGHAPDDRFGEAVGAAGYMHG